MQHHPGFYKRLTLLALQRDLIRVAIALLVLLALLLGHAPLALILAVPLLVYFGLWLLRPAVADRSLPEARDALRRSEKPVALQEVRSARDRIAGAARQAPDPVTSASMHRISEWIDRSLDVIAEDKKPETLAPLLELATFTSDLLDRYIKLCRRGLANTQTHEQMKQNLAVIEERFKWFWEQLNRDAIVDLAALSAAIDLFMETVPPAAELNLMAADSPASPSGDPLNGHSGESAAARNGGHTMANGASGSSNSRELALLATLTAREFEVLQHIAGGRTNQQIADSMFISNRTVAKHVQIIFDKLNVQNRTEAAAFAFRCGIVPLTHLPDDFDRPPKSA